jgi:hypothetical protein
LVRELDPYHPVTLNVNFGAAKYRRWAHIVDLPSVDYYPLPIHPLWAVARNVAEMSTAAPFLPLRYWLQSVGDMRDPTPRELQSMVYMAAVHGCQQFLFWNYRPMSPEVYGMWTQCSGELAAIADALAATKRRPIIDESPGRTIHASLRFVDRETAYLIAINVLDKPATARLSITELSGVAKAEVLFEQRTVAITNRAIQDTFTPLERHVYRFSLSK